MDDATLKSLFNCKPNGLRVSCEVPAETPSRTMPAALASSDLRKLPVRTGLLPTSRTLIPNPPLSKVQRVASLNEETTEILLALSNGNREAADRLLPVIYDEMRRVANWYMSGERAGHTLEPTALVHEAFLRLRRMEHVQWTSRTHFCAVGAHIMRRVLVDHARRRNADKRGAQMTRLQLDENFAEWAPKPDVDLIDMSDALDRLAKLNSRHVQIVEMRFFAGLSVEETAGVLGVSPSTVKNDWRMARAWLLAQMEADRES